MTPQLPQDVAALVELAVAHADGAHPLFEGHLESVASLYQVHPERVERARQASVAPHARRLASALVEQARSSRAESRDSSRAAPRDAASLVTEALASSDTMEVLMKAPMELAAVQLGAHPFTVEEARLRLSTPRPGARAS